MATLLRFGRVLGLKMTSSSSPRIEGTLSPHFSFTCVQDTGVSFIASDVSLLFELNAFMSISSEDEVPSILEVNEGSLDIEHDVSIKKLSMVSPPASCIESF